MEEWNKQLEEYQKELATLKPLSDAKNIYWVGEKARNPLSDPLTMSMEEFHRIFCEINNPQLEAVHE